MTEIEQKVLLVRKYIMSKKNVDIIDINLKDGLDLQKLDYAYGIAYNFFYGQFIFNTCCYAQLFLNNIKKESTVSSIGFKQTISIVKNYYALTYLCI